ncbi:MAG: DNA-3-methyladenine glycosylase [Myxococcota bacterium]
MAKRVPKSFFQRDTCAVAQMLLGKELVREQIRLRITEVEAYLPDDSACHARSGPTKRNAAMFGPPGRAYVYLCYGLHHLLNIATEPEGVGAAVLIRSCEPLTGHETIYARREGKAGAPKGPALLTGPGKVGQALGVDVSWSGHPLYQAGGLEIREGPPPEQRCIGPRVGIGYADPEDRDAPLRFAIANTPWVSQRKTLTLV